MTELITLKEENLFLKNQVEQLQKYKDMLMKIRTNNKKHIKVYQQSKKGKEKQKAAYKRWYNKKKQLKANL